MGHMIIDTVIQLLRNGGLRAAAAYPAGRITRVMEPVAAVSLEQADLEAQTAVVLVEILGPREGGGYPCQQKALEACAILESGGAVCIQNRCRFQRSGDLFCVPIKAVFRGIARANALEQPFQPTIIAGGMTLSYVTAFSAEQDLRAEDATLFSSPWDFVLEEFFPWGVWNTLEPNEPFTLDLRVGGDVERFEKCTWTHRERIKEAGGIRQKRKGHAQSHSLTKAD